MSDEQMVIEMIRCQMHDRLDAQIDELRAENAALRAIQRAELLDKPLVKAVGA